MSILGQNIFQNVRTRVLVLDSSRILLRRAPDSEAWRPPGGGLEPSESLRECAEREVLEETGLRVRAGDVAFLREWIVPRYAPAPDGSTGHGYGLEVFVYADLVDDTSRLLASEGASTNRWFELSELAALPLWPKELRPLAARLLRGGRPTGAMIIGRFEDPNARADTDPFP